MRRFLAVESSVEGESSPKSTGIKALETKPSFAVFRRSRLPAEEDMLHWPLEVEVKSQEGTTFVVVEM
jgi:hypothetical protein